MRAVVRRLLHRPPAWVLLGIALVICASGLWLDGRMTRHDFQVRDGRTVLTQRAGCERLNFMRAVARIEKPYARVLAILDCPATVAAGGRPVQLPMDRQDAFIERARGRLTIGNPTPRCTALALGGDVPRR